MHTHTRRSELVSAGFSRESDLTVPWDYLDCSVSPGRPVVSQLTLRESLYSTLITSPSEPVSIFSLGSLPSTSRSICTRQTPLSDKSLDQELVHHVLLLLLVLDLYGEYYFLCSRFKLLI